MGVRRKPTLQNQDRMVVPYKNCAQESVITAYKVAAAYLTLAVCIFCLAT